MSELSSRSSVKEKRIQAAKANLALRLAEQEQRRVMEGELRLHEIEKKQRELARQQKLEEEELERCRRLEALKLETDRKLAEARQQAGLTSLEAQLEEKIDDNEVIDMDLVSDDERGIYDQPTESHPKVPPPAWFLSGSASYQDFKPAVRKSPERTKTSLFEHKPYVDFRDSSYRTGEFNCVQR